MAGGFCCPNSMNMDSLEKNKYLILEDGKLVLVSRLWFFFSFFLLWVLDRSN